MKSDWIGGVVMFGIMFAIAMISLYVVKSVKGSQAKTDPKAACEKVGGEWTGDRNPEDPCCYQPKITPPANVPLCLGGPAVPFP